MSRNVFDRSEEIFEEDEPDDREILVEKLKDEKGLKKTAQQVLKNMGEDDGES